MRVSKMAGKLNDDMETLINSCRNLVWMLASQKQVLCVHKCNALNLSVVTAWQCFYLSVVEGGVY